MLHDTEKVFDKAVAACAKDKAEAATFAKRSEAHVEEAKTLLGALTGRVTQLSSDPSFFLHNVVFLAVNDALAKLAEAQPRLLAATNDGKSRIRQIDAHVSHINGLQAGLAKHFKTAGLTSHSAAPPSVDQAWKDDMQRLATHNLEKYVGAERRESHERSE